MPIYDFRCDSCETEFEHLVRGRDWTNEVQCPSCGQAKPERLEKLPSRPGGIQVSAGSSSGASCSGNPMSCGRCQN